MMKNVKELEANTSNKLSSKIPIWEEEEFMPYDETVRNYRKSSYAYDRAAVERAKEGNKLWDVNVSKIAVGEKYGYKELCDLMGEEYYKTSRCQKDAQERVWRCFFGFEKVYVLGRQYFLITKKYDEPRYELYLSRDTEKELTGDYSKYIYQVLLMCLYRKDREGDGNDFFEFRTTKWNLFKVLGFANELFFQNYAFPGEYEIIDIKEEDCFKRYKEGSLQMQFYKDAFGKFNRTLSDALETLHRCKKINYYWDLHIKVGGKWRRANRVECATVTRIEGEELGIFGCEEVSEILLKGKIREHREAVKKRLLVECGIENYYDEIDVWVMKGNVKTGIVRMYERYTGKNVLNEMGLSPEQLCQKENAENLNELIKRYFYELNAPKRAKQNAEWYIERSYNGVVSDEERREFYDRALRKQNEMIKKYIELDSYLEIVTCGPKDIVRPEDVRGLPDDDIEIVREINRDEKRKLYGE